MITLKMLIKDILTGELKISRHLSNCSLIVLLIIKELDSESTQNNIISKM